MKREKGQSSFLILLVLLFLATALIVAIVERAARQPQLVQVDADAAFIYPGPTAGEFLLALPQGAFRVEGGLMDGCYLLEEPAIGAEHGRATWVRAECEK